MHSHWCNVVNITGNLHFAPRKFWETWCKIKLLLNRWLFSLWMLYCNCSDCGQISLAWSELCQHPFSLIEDIPQMYQFQIRKREILQLRVFLRFNLFQDIMKSYQSATLQETRLMPLTWIVGCFVCGLTLWMDL